MKKIPKTQLPTLRAEQPASTSRKWDRGKITIVTIGLILGIIPGLVVLAIFSQAKIPVKPGSLTNKVQIKSTFLQKKPRALSHRGLEFLKKRLTYAYQREIAKEKNKEPNESFFYRR